MSLFTHRFMLGLATSLLLCLNSSGLQAQDMASENAELEVLKTAVKEKEANLTESQAKLQAQSDTLQCLGERLQGYSTCEQQQAINMDTDSLSACLEAVRNQVTNCEADLTQSTQLEYMSLESMQLEESQTDSTQTASAAADF